jgi:hypothetical protein
MQSLVCSLATCTRATEEGELFCGPHGKLRVPQFLAATAEKNKQAFERIVAIVAARIPHKLTTR